MQMLSASWRVLRDDKQLLVFPVIAVVAALVIVAVFAVPVLGLFLVENTTHDGFGGETSTYSMQPMGWVVTAVGYVLAMYVGTFVNAGLVVAANERLTGTGPGTVSSGFRGASAKAGSLAAWVLVAATVGFLLRALEQRLGIIGRIVVGLVGIAWSLLTIMIVPVLVLEERQTVTSAIARSGTLFRDTWGENLIGAVGFGLVGFFVALVGMAVFMVGVATGSAAMIIALGVVALVWVVVAAQVLAALTGIYRVALYRFAVDGRAPLDYAGIDFTDAFREKRGPLSGGTRRRVVRSAPMGAPVDHHDPWKAWQPPDSGPIRGDGGVEIPGAQTLPSHRRPRPPAAPAPWADDPSRAKRPDEPDWPGA